MSPPPDHRSRSPHLESPPVDLTRGLSIGSMLPRSPPMDSAPSLGRVHAPTAANGYPWVAVTAAGVNRPAPRVAAKVPGGLAEGESLPRLECRGQGKPSGREESPPPKSMQKSQSTSALALGAHSQHMYKVPAANPGQLHGAEGLLTIGSLNIPVVGPPAPPPSDPAKPSGNGKLQQRPPPGLIASRSAPQLAPGQLAPGPSPMPRLLMQSVY